MRINLALLLAVTFAPIASAQTGFLDRTITIGAEVYRYQVYVPAEYVNTSAWPVIVSLHGAGRQGADGMQQTSTDFGARVRNFRASIPALVVFPQARPNTRFMNPDMEALVMAELRRTIAEFRVDTARIYLHGNSMGGEGAYRIAFRWPAAFAALLITAGQVLLSDAYPAEQIALDRETNTFAGAANPYDALARGIKGIPVWIFHGDADQTIPVTQAQQLVAALKRVNGNVRYTEYPGADHNGTAPKALAESEVFPWLFGQKR